MAADEEARAAEYRRKETARSAWCHFMRFEAFPGDDEAADAVKAAWEPVTNTDRGWDPPGDWCYDEEPVRQPSPLGPVAIGQGLQLP